MSEPNPQEAPPYGDKSPFVRLLSTPGRVRVLDAFLRKYRSEMSANDIHTLTGLSESAFSRNKDVLLNLDIISQTRKEGGTHYYRLNTDEEIVKLLGNFHTELLSHADRITEKTAISEEEYIGKLTSVKTSGGGSQASADSQADAENDQQVNKEFIEDIADA